MPLYWAASAGGLTGTTGALTQAIHDLFNNKIINSKLLKTQGLVNTSNGKPVTNIKTDCARSCYGLGVTVNYDTNIEGLVWAYQGGTFGFFTYYYWIPKEDVVIAVSQNSTSDQTNLDPVMYQLNNTVRAYLH